MSVSCPSTATAERAPATIVSGSPIASRRRGTTNSRRSAPRSIRDASEKSTTVSVASATQRTESLSTVGSSQPRASALTSMPPATNTIAGVITDRESRRETPAYASTSSAIATRPEPPTSASGGSRRRNTTTEQRDQTSHQGWLAGLELDDSLLVSQCDGASPEIEPALTLRSLLAGHCDAESFLRTDEVVGVFCVLAEVDLHPVDSAGEDAGLAVVVVADRGGGVSSDVGGLVRGEDQRHGCLDAAFTGLVAVEVERDGAALCGAAAVVGELHPHLVRSGRDRGVGLDLEALQAEQVVAVGWTPILRVQAPAGEGAALGDDHAFGARLGHDDFRRDGAGLVLDVEDAVLAQATHAANSSCEFPFTSSGRPTSSALKRSMRRSSSGSTLYLRASWIQSCCSSASFSGISAARSCAWLQSVFVS